MSFFATGSTLAQDITNLGGALTSSLSPQRITVQLPSPNISSQELFDYHLTGFVEFHRSFQLVKLDGKSVLGPNFNHNSCGGCHTQNGKGRINFSSNGSSLLIRVSKKKNGGLNNDGSPVAVGKFGTQLQDHMLGKGSRFDIQLSYKQKTVKYPDGDSAKLRTPRLTFDLPGLSETQERRLLRSMLMSPPMIGLGLLEAVPVSTLEAMADPDDLDQDGISGRIQYVPSIETGQTEVGRFGFKATNPSVLEQNAGAFFADMGMTSSIHPDPKNPDRFEASDDILERITFYLQAAGVPAARDQDDPDVVAGKSIFQEVKCDSCHKMTLNTADSDVIEVANQEFHPFTDLLLHDMGNGLADRRPVFEATGKEWRTTPLWGLGLHFMSFTDGGFNNFQRGLLHDGRARTIEEAILWHGGEAENSVIAFKSLPKSEREQLLRFLESL